MIPDRLNECEIPLVEIDDTRTLDRLQKVDLFPPQHRDQALRRLVRALRAAPRHPKGDSGDDDLEISPTLRTYLEKLCKEVGSISIRGLQVGTGQAHRFAIDQLYISLTTMATVRHGGEKSSDPALAGKGAADHQQERHVLLQQTLDQQRVVIVGDPGAGKTTFLRRLAFALCQLQLKQTATDDPFCQALDGQRFPVFVRLSNLIRYVLQSRNMVGMPTDDESPAWLPYHLAEISSKDFGCQLDKDFFEGQLDAGRCVVLLDGLDEAPDRPSRETLSRLIEKASARYDGCRFVVTSRPPAYTEGVVLPDFGHARIDPLADEAVETFLDRWCNSLYGDNQSAAQRHCDELLRALAARPDIRDMVRNPVMLTALAVVHWNERRLPEQRADLYASIISWLSRSREQRPGRPTAERSAAHLGWLALAMQDHPDGRQTQVPQDWAAEKIADRFAEASDPVRAAKEFLTAEELDSGIVVGRGHEIRFWHLTFQEYLAADTIAGLREMKQAHLLLGRDRKLYRPEWREVVLLLAGILHGPEADRVDGLVETILENLFEEPTLIDQQPQLADQARCAGLLGAIRRDLAPLGYRPADPRYDDLMRTVMAIFDSQGSRTVPIETRVAAAEALGQSGDPRPGVGLQADPPGIPDILWCDVPGGTLMMGSSADDQEADDNEYGPVGKPFPVDVQPFRLAAYPVTCAQFRPFVKGGGYQDPQYWTQAGWEWKQSESKAMPDMWDDLRWNIGNYPVIGVTWYEAVAWCRWLTSRLREVVQLSEGREIRLPTEREWEWAARGPGGLKYPWGDQWRDDACNNEAAGLERTCAVGLFPGGVSRWLEENTDVMCYDLSGNVWEWCSTKWQNPYTGDADDSLEGDAGRTLRGGAYYCDAQGVRCAYRGRLGPDYRYVGFGFRCVQ